MMWLNDNKPWSHHSPTPDNRDAPTNSFGHLHQSRVVQIHSFLGSLTVVISARYQTQEERSADQGLGGKRAFQHGKAPAGDGIFSKLIPS